MSRGGRARSSQGLVIAVVAILLIAALALFLLRRGAVAPAPVPTAPGVPAGTPGAVAPSGAWEVWFTQPLPPPDNDPSKHRGSLDARLVALMSRATKTLDVADYDFDLADVADAMAAAAARGVRVRMVTDTDTLTNTKNTPVQSAFATLKKAKIPIVDDQRKPIMHNKFTVVDGEWVEMGSWNYTDGDTYHLNNNMAIFQSPQLAQNYTAEFEKMFTQKKFGPNKPKGVPYPTLQIGGMQVQNYFAAEDGVAQHVIDAIEGAKTSIHFLAFSFTHDGIGQAMLQRAKAGVDLQGVFETTGSTTSFSEYPKMKKAGIPVWQDGNPYVMHHKVIIIDGRITIFGSFNFSDNADTANDENLIIVDDPTFAAQFEQEYQRVLATAKNPPASKKKAPDATPLPG